MVVARSAAGRVRGGVGRRRRQIVGRVNRIGVKQQFVAESCADSIESQVQILGLAIAAGHRKAQIHTTVPAFQ